MLKLTLLTALLALGGKVAAGAGAVASRSIRQGSMIRGISSARVEPITLIDSNVFDYERIDDLCHFSINTFAVIYLQGIALSGTTVGKVKIRQRLEGHNPTGEFSLESEINQPNEAVVGAILDDEEVLYEQGLPSAQDYISLESGANVRSASESLRDVNALSVGKVLNVDITEEGITQSVPVTIRLATVRARNDVLIEAMKQRFSSGETALERKVGWKKGRLSLIRDVLLCRDLRRKNMQAMIEDEDGITAKLNPSRMADYAKAAVSGNMSMAGASNILFLDSRTASQIEKALGGRFDAISFRQRMLENTGIMILVVVDREADIVTLYLDSVADGTEISGRNLQKVAKSDGPDVNMLLSALANSSARGSLRFN